MVSRVSTERMRIRKIRIRKIRINPLATRDLAEKHVLKLVEGFFGHCRPVSELNLPEPYVINPLTLRGLFSQVKISACKVRHAQKAKFRHSFWV